MMIRPIETKKATAFFATLVSGLARHSLILIPADLHSLILTYVPLSTYLVCIFTHLYKRL